MGASKIAPEAIIAPAAVVPSVQVSAVAARDGAKAAHFATAHRIGEVFEGYEALVTSDAVDLVYCALPISHHAYWCCRALEAGKDVLCEKPFAMNQREAEQVLAMAAANDGRVIEAFHYAHHPAFHTCLDWVRGGKVGKVRRISARFAAPAAIDPLDIRSIPALGGGAMMDLGCYPLHWVQALVDGVPTDIQASAKLGDAGVDVALSAQLQFEGGVQAEISTAMGADALLEINLTIEGTLGKIQFANPLAPHHGAKLEALLQEGGQRAQISPISTYCYQLADIANALASGAPLANEGTAIVRQQQTLDAVYTAAGLADLRASTYP